MLQVFLLINKVLSCVELRVKVNKEHLGLMKSGETVRDVDGKSGFADPAFHVDEGNWSCMRHEKTKVDVDFKASSLISRRPFVYIIKASMRSHFRSRV